MLSQTLGENGSMVVARREGEQAVPTSTAIPVLTASAKAGPY